MVFMNTAVESSLKTSVILIILICALERGLAETSKLCGDAKCTEKLFEAKFIRGYDSNHHALLSYSSDHVIKVYAFRKNDRPELFEGELNHKPNHRGYFFSSHMEMDAYADFLKKALETNRTFFKVSGELDGQSSGAPKVIGEVSAVPELLKVYEKVLEVLASARGEDSPPFDLAALGLKKISDDSHAGHGHSHGPHGHSHDVYVKIHEGHLHNQDTENMASVTLAGKIPSTTTTVKPAVTVREKNIAPEVSTTPSNKYSPTFEINKLVEASSTPVSPQLQNNPEVSLSQQDIHRQDSITFNVNEKASSPLPNINEKPVVAAIVSNNIESPSSDPDLNNIVSSKPVLSEKGNMQEASTPSVMSVTSDSATFEVTTVSQRVISQKSFSTVPEGELLEKNTVASDIGLDTQVTSHSTTVAPSTQIAFSSQQQTTGAVTLASINSDFSTASPVTVVGSTEMSLPSHTTSYSTIISTATFSSRTLLTSPDSFTPPLTATDVHDKIYRQQVQEQQYQTSTMKESTDIYQQYDDRVHQSSNVYDTLVNTPTPVNEGSTVTSLPPYQRSSEELASSTTITASEPVKQNKQSVTAEPLQAYDIVGSDGLGYCVKGNCGSSLSRELPLQSKENLAKPIQKLFRNLSSMYTMPSGEIDLTKIIFLLLGTVLLSIHLVVMIFGSESREENVECKLLHDALSALKVRDQRIKELFCEVEKTRNSIISDSSDEVIRLDKELKLREEELKRLHRTEYDLKRIAEENNGLKDALSHEESKVKVMAEQLNKSESSLRMLNEQLIEVQGNRDMIKDENDHLKKENAENNVKIEKSVQEIGDLKEKLNAIAEEKRNLYKQIDDLKFENAQLSELYDTMQKHTTIENAVPATESANISDERGVAQEGTGGWSDIDDFDIDVVDEKKVTVAKIYNDGRLVKERSVESYSSPLTSNIVEIARLRGQLERAKIKLQDEEKNSEELLRRLNIAENEAARCLKEVELKDAERIDVSTQCKKLLAMVEEKDTRLKRLDEVIERLRDEKTKVQNEIKKLYEEKQNLETRLNEVEQELKHLQLDHDRLKKRHFHELRECRQENIVLQQRLKSRQAGAAESMLDDSGNLLNLSGNVAENNSLSPSGLLPGLSVPPLWSDGDTDVFSGAESSRAERNSLSRSRQLFFDDISQHSTGKTQKPRHREHREASPEPSSMRPRKEGRRMRSRSHGRSSVYMASGMPYPFSSGFDLAARREYLSGGNLYYSSGGSNGGLSPPPLALLSGVPPVDVALRKPMASTRPKSVVEHGSKNQS